MPRVTTAKQSALPTDFSELVAMYPPQAIYDEVGYDNAQEMIDRLTSTPRLSKGQRDYLNTLAILFEAYEKQHHALDTADLTGIDVLKFILDQNDMTASDLGRLLGNRELGVKIMNGSRELSKANIRTVCDRFGVSADLFI